MQVKQHIPNLLTIGNLICGCLGIVYANRYGLYISAYFVWAAGLFDFLDGYVARWMNTSSVLGKQLDSLADMVSFGVLPGVIMFNLLNATSSNHWLAYSAWLMVVCAALRLGKFNSNQQQKHFFIGLPTPANAFFISGLIFLPPPLDETIFNVFVLFGIVVVFSSLMIMPVRLFSLKDKNLSWRTDKIRLTFITLSILLLGFQQAGAISLIILLYILFSLADNWISGKKMTTTP